jgi:hypothetical protein
MNSTIERSQRCARPGVSQCYSLEKGGKAQHVCKSNKIWQGPSRGTTIFIGSSHAFQMSGSRRNRDYIAISAPGAKGHIILDIITKTLPFLSPRTVVDEVVVFGSVGNDLAIRAPPPNQHIFQLAPQDERDKLADIIVRMAAVLEDKWPNAKIVLASIIPRQYNSMGHLNRPHCPVAKPGETTIVKRNWFNHAATKVDKKLREIPPGERTWRFLNLYDFLAVTNPCRPHSDKKKRKDLSN